MWGGPFLSKPESPLDFVYSQLTNWIVPYSIVPEFLLTSLWSFQLRNQCEAGRRLNCLGCSKMFDVSFWFMLPYCLTFTVSDYLVNSNWIHNGVFPCRFRQPNIVHATCVFWRWRKTSSSTVPQRWVDRAVIMSNGGGGFSLLYTPVN